MTPPDKTPRAAAYLRVSSARQVAEGLSLDVQRENVERYAAAYGLELVEVYTERGISGRKDDRPELSRLMAELHRFDVLVIPRLDRLGRSTRHLEETTHALREADVRLVSLAETIDTESSHGRFFLRMLASLAELESERLSERVAEVTEQKAREGRYHGGPRPYGYDFAGGGRLEAVPKEAAVVRTIYAEYLAGTPLRHIAEHLNSDGTRTARGKEWSQNRVADILDSERYAGLRKWDEELIPSELIPPLVSLEDWEKAQQARSATRGSRQRGRTPEGQHLFRGGLLRCGYHDAYMSPRTYKAPGGRPTGSQVYYCSHANAHGKDSCPLEPIPREAIDRAALDYFERVAMDAAATRRAIEETVNRRLAEVRELRKSAERRAMLAQDGYNRKRDQFKYDQITPEEWREVRDELTQERATAEQEAERLTEEARQLEAGGPIKDAEALLQRQLAELRAAVAGEITNAQALEDVRAKLGDLFDAFHVVRAEPETIGLTEEDTADLTEEQAATLERSVRTSRMQVDAEVAHMLSDGESTAFRAAEYLILPTPRPEVIEGIDEPAGWRPVLRQVPLGDWESKGRDGLPWR